MKEKYGAYVCEDCKVEMEKMCGTKKHKMFRCPECGREEEK